MSLGYLCVMWGSDMIRVFHINPLHRNKGSNFGRNLLLSHRRLFLYHQLMVTTPTGKFDDDD